MFGLAKRSPATDSIDTSTRRTPPPPNYKLSSGGGRVSLDPKKPTCPRRLLQRLVRWARCSALA